MRYLTQCCDEVIESKTVHDFVQCPCGKSFVDGGSEYMRLGSNTGEFPIPLDKESNVPTDD